MLFRTLRIVLYRVMTRFYLQWMRPKGLVIGKNPMLYGLPIFQLKESSQIKIGDDVVLCSDSNFTALCLAHPVKVSTVREGAKITIGNHVGVSGACIVSATSISIGAEVLLGSNVLIVDTDFHPISHINRRHSDDVSKILSLPVSIGNNVFVGSGAIILKGVTIGDDSIVAAGSVVTAGDYVKGSIIAGNPGKIIGTVY